MGSIRIPWSRRQLHPKDDEAHAGLAAAYFNLANLDASESAAKAALRLRSTNANARVLLGSVYAFRKQWAEAQRQQAYLERVDVPKARTLAKVIRALRAEAAKGGATFDPFVAEVAFDNLSDADERQFFNDVATTWDLDDETVDRLIEVGGRLLRESPDFKRFMATVK